jgi:hypothetical protein
MKETSKILYRKGKEVFADVTYSLTVREVEILCRDYMDATLRGIVNDPETSNTYLSARLDQIIS